MQVTTTSRSGRTYTENETLNSMVPIWKKSKKELKDEDYNSFYTQKFYDYQHAAVPVIHSSVEGAVHVHGNAVHPVSRADGLLHQGL